MSEPTPELEAAARAMLVAYDQRVPWGLLTTPENQCLVLARAAIAAVLQEPSEELVAAVSIQNGDAGGMTARFIIRAAGRHILGEET